MTSGFMFSPSNLTIAVGDTVTAHNTDSGHHTFTDTPAFDSGDMAPGASFRYRFTKAGTYSFVCTYHSGAGMKGSVTVRQLRSSRVVPGQQATRRRTGVTFDVVPR
jgi:plastocyanin